jgi:hypothetical protein
MKRLFMLSLAALAIVAACAAANPVKSPWGYLVPSPDPTRTDLMICDKTPGLLNIYVVCRWWNGSTAVQFSAPQPACFTAAWLSDTHVFPVTIGNSQYGVAVGFGSCRMPPVHVLTITYFAYGATPADCVYPTLPDPQSGSGWIEIADCNFNLVQVSDGGNYINPPEAACGSTPAETMTWGRVKSLFNE